MKIPRFLALCLVFLGTAPLASAQTTTVSVPFNSGFVGTEGQNTSKDDNILNFATLGIKSAKFSQPSTTGQFGGTQGNDLSGTVEFVLTNNSVIDIPGAINWRINTGSTVDYFGFIPDPSNPPQTITYSGGTYTFDSTKNYALQEIGDTQNYADGSNVSGNAALSGLVSALNTYLNTINSTPPSITASKTVSVVHDTSSAFNCATGTAITGANFFVPGACLDYTITVTSTANGSAAVSNFTFNDTVPANLSVVGIYSQTGFDSVSQSGNAVSGTITSFSAGTSASMDIRCTIN